MPEVVVAWCTWGYEVLTLGLLTCELCVDVGGRLARAPRAVRAKLQADEAIANRSLTAELDATFADLAVRACHLDIACGSGIAKRAR